MLTVNQQIIGLLSYCSRYAMCNTVHYYNTFVFVDVELKLKVFFCILITL